MKENRKIKVGIIGGSGYAGEELIKFASATSFYRFISSKFKRIIK